MKTSYLSTLIENTCLSFKLIKRKFALLTHSRFDIDAM